MRHCRGSFLPIQGRFIGVVAVPPLARSLGAILDEASPPMSATGRRTAVGVGIFAISLVAFGSTFRFLPVPAGSAPIGIGFDVSVVPEGALSYLDRSQVSGRVFNTFQFGGYIAWRRQPLATPHWRTHVARGLSGEISP